MYSNAGVCVNAVGEHIPHVWVLQGALTDDVRTEIMSQMGRNEVLWNSSTHLPFAL